MGIVLRVYLGWRLLRLLRRLLIAAALAGVVLALHGHRVQVNGSAVRALSDDASAALRELPRAFERPSHRPH